MNYMINFSKVKIKQGKKLTVYQLTEAHLTGTASKGIQKKRKSYIPVLLKTIPQQKPLNLSTNLATDVQVMFQQNFWCTG